MASFSQGISIEAANLVAMGQLAKQLPLGKQNKVLATKAGAQRSPMRGRGMEFSEVRAYQAGDDIRQMDWRITARTQQAHIKLYQEEKERPVMLMLDLRANMRFGSKRAFKSVLAADIAALIGWAAKAESDRIGAWVFNDNQELDFRAKANKRHLLSLFHKLSEFSKQASTINNPQARFSQMLRHINRTSRPGSLIYLISDFYGFSTECLASIKALTQHSDVRAIQVMDKLQQTLPPPGQYAITDGQQYAQLNTQSKAQREKFSAQAKAQQASLQQHFLNLGVPHICIFTHDNPMAKLRAGLGISSNKIAAYQKGA